MFLEVKFSIYLNRHVFVMKRKAFKCAKLFHFFFPNLPYFVTLLLFSSPKKLLRKENLIFFFLDHFVHLIM